MGSGYLHQDDAVFYHPCDDHTEHKEGKTWINYNDSMTFTSGVAVSGITRTSNYNGRIESTNAAYPRCSGDSSWTFACWINNEWDSGSQEMWAGWYNGTSYDNILRIGLGPTSVHPRIRAGGVSDDFQAKTREHLGSGLYVLHVEFYGTTASGWFSQNGSGWVSCGQVDVNTPNEEADRVFCGKYNYSNKYGTISILDELVFWHNTAKFTSAELLNLYNLLHESGLTMDHYRQVYGPWDSAASVPLATSGLGFASDSIALVMGSFTKGSAALSVHGKATVSGSADLFLAAQDERYLHPEEVLIYHPCEPNGLEVKGGRTWNEHADTVYYEGVLGSGIGNASNNKYGGFWTPSGNYVSPTGSTSWTFAFWTNKLDSRRNNCKVGWLSSATSNTDWYNSFQIIGMDDYASWNFQVYNGSTLLQGTIPHNTAGSGFIVGRIEWHDGSGFIYGSFNGSGWQPVASGAFAQPDNQGPYLRIVGERGNLATGGVWFDEVIFWKDTGRFTDQELQNLYDLARIQGRPMNEYQAAYGMPIDAAADLSLRGLDTASSGADLSVQGHTSASGTAIPLSAGGHALGSGSSDLFVHGRAAASGDAPLGLRGHAPASADIPLFGSGHGLVSDSIALVFPGLYAISGIPLHAHGSAADSGSADLFAWGSTAPSGEDADFYLQGHAVDSGYSPLHTHGQDAASGSAPLTLFFPESTSGSCALYLKNNQVGGLLHNDDAIWYHPLEPDKTEKLKDLVWNQGGGAFSSAVLGSGFTHSSTWSRLQHPSGLYASPYGSKSWTFAFWCIDPDGDGQGWYAGWTTSYIEPRNCINVEFDSSTIKVKLITRNGSAQFPNDHLTALTALTGSGFYVVHVEFGQTQATGWISENGSGWQSLGVVTRDPPDNTGDDVYVTKYKGGSIIGDVVLDEAVFWKDTGKFRDWELANLYHLAATHGLTMDQYEATFPLATGQLPLHVLSIGETSQLVALSVAGALPTSGDAPLYQHGVGPVPFSGSAPLYMQVPSGWNDSADLYIQGPLQATGEAILHLENRWRWHHQPLFLYNQQAIDSCPLYIYGNEQYHGSGFVRVWYDRPGQGANLFVRGQPSGESGTIHFLSDSVPFHTVNVDEPYAVSGSYLGFARVNWSSFAEQASGAWSALTRVDGFIHDEAPLFAYGHASGSPPQEVATPYADHCPLYIEGSGDVFSDGYTQFSSSGFPAFARVGPGANGSIPMTLFNFQGTGYAPFYAFGISGIASGASPLSVAGRDAAARATTLYMFGISGFLNDSVPIYLEVTDTGVLVGGTTLYAHGY